MKESYEVMLRVVAEDLFNDSKEDADYPWKTVEEQMDEMRKNSSERYVKGVYEIIIQQDGN